ncbi:hypothetical protein HQ585_08825 [candidate division KSB1 bacterium]|nr:hypothetical protein [candidate division KSB1 bacterium]
MNRTLITLIFISLFLFQISVAIAHPPSKIILEFNAETSILKVEMPHKVKDASEHFINKVEIKLNGKEIVKQEFFTQKDTGKQMVMYQIHDAKSGDTLEVTAHCNVFSKKKETIQIP